MRLFQYLLSLIYLTIFTSACDVSADEGQGYRLTAEESAELGQLIIEDDDMQALVDLLGDGPFAYTPEMRGHLHAIVELGRVDYFEYLLSNLVGKEYEDMIGLLDFALKEHKVDACQCILNNGDDDNYGALVTLDNDDELTGFWAKRPFLWTEDELDGLLTTDRFLLHYICPDYSFLDVGLDTAIVLAVIGILCFYGDGEDFDSPTEILEGVLGSNLGDDLMAQLIGHLIENDADVSEDMCVRFAQDHQAHVHSMNALHEGLSGHQYAHQLKLMMAEGDQVPDIVYGILEGRPLRYARHIVYLFQKAIKWNCISFFETLLPLLGALPADLYNRKMTTLFVACLYLHNQEMCKMLLSRGFDYEYEHARYSLSDFWGQPECPWEEEELADVISLDPRWAERICLLPKELRRCRNHWVISLIIAMNHQFAAQLGKDYDDPTASLKAVLKVPLSDAGCAMIVRQLFELGAVVTEAMRARYVEWHPAHREVLEALDEALSIPDVKHPEE